MTSARREAMWRQPGDLRRLLADRDPVLDRDLASPRAPDRHRLVADDGAKPRRRPLTLDPLAVAHQDLECPLTGVLGILARVREPAGEAKQRRALPVHDRLDVDPLDSRAHREPSAE